MGGMHIGRRGAGVATVRWTARAHTCGRPGLTSSHSNDEIINSCHDLRCGGPLFGFPKEAPEKTRSEQNFAR